MAAKSANLYARIEPDVKEKAENILSTLGIPASSAINMKQNSLKNWRKDIRICKLDGLKMRKKPLQISAMIMAYDL